MTTISTLTEVELAVIKAIARENCKRSLQYTHYDRVIHFNHRIVALGCSPRDVVIVVINVDEPLGGPLADVLMPEYEWASIRATGQIPYARGLACRAGIQDVLDQIDHDEGNKLRAIDGVAVAVVDWGVVCVCAAGEVLGGTESQVRP